MKCSVLSNNFVYIVTIQFKANQSSPLPCHVTLVSCAMYQHQTSLNLISPWNDVITSPACQLHVYYSNCQIEHKLKTCSNFSGWQGILWTRNVHSRVQTSNDLLTHSILKIRPCERKKRAPYPLRRTNQIRTGNKYMYVKVTFVYRYLQHTTIGSKNSL